MKRKRLLIMLGSVCLALMLAVPLVASCAPATPEEAAGEVAALESKLAAEKAKVSGLQGDVSDLEAEIAELRAPGEVEVTTWRWQTYAGTEEDFWVQRFVQDIEKMSDGRLVIDWYYGGTLVPSDQMLDAVRTGLLDGSHGAGCYWPGEILLGNLESMPFEWCGWEHTIRIWHGLGFLELMREDYAEHGIYFLAPDIEGVRGAYNLISNQPVSSLDDMRKLKIRTSGPTAKVLEKVGVATVFLPVEEVYTAAATGAIDGFIYGTYVHYYGMGMQEVFGYYLEDGFQAPYCCSWFVNMDAFNAIPANLQTIVENAADVVGYYWCPSQWDKEDIEAREKLADEGVSFTHMDDEGLRELREAGLELLDEEAAKSPRNAAAVALIKQAHQEFGFLD